MSERSRRLGKKNELRAVVEAIGSSLGKTAAQVAAESQDDSGKAGRKMAARKAAAKRRAAERLTANKP